MLLLIGRLSGTSRANALPGATLTLTPSDPCTHITRRRLPYRYLRVPGCLPAIHRRRYLTLHAALVRLPRLVPTTCRLPYCHYLHFVTYSVRGVRPRISVIYGTVDSCALSVSNTNDALRRVTGDRYDSSNCSLVIDVLGVLSRN